MFSVFNLNNGNSEQVDNAPDSIDIDDLYEIKHQKDMQKQTMFKRILKRIHTKITNTSKITKDTFCWITIPEVILGLQGYNNADCIAFVTHHLRSNKFDVTYYHPNTLLVSWTRWIPSYVREEIRLKTGVEVDELGQPKKQPEQDAPTPELYVKEEENNKKKKTYEPITNYRTTGKLIYGDDVMTNPLSK
jgi:hypothetical protein